MSMSTEELMDRGMRCLVEKLGVVNAERFIAAVLRERFDYTEWQRARFDDERLESLNAAAMAWAAKHEAKSGIVPSVEAASRMHAGKEGPAGGMR